MSVILKFIFAFNQIIHIVRMMMTINHLRIEFVEIKEKMEELISRVTKIGEILESFAKLNAIQCQRVEPETISRLQNIDPVISRHQSENKRSHPEDFASAELFRTPIDLDGVASELGVVRSSKRIHSESEAATRTPTERESDTIYRSQSSTDFISRSETETPSYSRGRKNWTPSDNEAFIGFYNRRVKIEIIANNLHRTVDQIRSKIKTERKKGTIV